MLFISLFIGRVRYTYYESSEYLPLDFNSKHLLIDAVQRSRHKKLKKVENKFPTIKKFVKNKYSGEHSTIFDKGKTLYYIIELYKLFIKKIIF